MCASTTSKRTKFRPIQLHVNVDYTGHSLVCCIHPFLLYDQCKYVRIHDVACCYFLAELCPIMYRDSESIVWHQRKEVSLIEFEYVAREVCFFSNRG